MNNGLGFIGFIYILGPVLTVKCEAQVPIFMVLSLDFTVRPQEPTCSRCIRSWTGSSASHLAFLGLHDVGCGFCHVGLQIGTRLYGLTWLCICIFC